jgi:multimeric flavodoxin WrbA
LQALILDGSFVGDDVIKVSREAIEGELRAGGWNVNSYTLRDIDIAACKGCFKCWTHSPGTCITDDEGKKMVEQFVHSDIAVFLTPVTFGGYSSVLKKALDRMIPVLLPFFEKSGGEVKHKPRYDNHPRLVALGVLPQADANSEKIFRALISRNAGNFYSSVHSVGVIYSNQNTDAIKSEVKTLLNRAGVVT